MPLHYHRTGLNLVLIAKPLPKPFIFFDFFVFFVFLLVLFFVYLFLLLIFFVINLLHALIFSEMLDCLPQKLLNDLF